MVANKQSDLHEAWYIALKENVKNNNHGHCYYCRVLHRG